MDNQAKHSFITTTPDGPSALKKRAENTNQLHLIVDMMRVGAQLFAVKMEYTYFPPRSGRNYLFEMALTSWPKEFKMTFAIFSFPIEYRLQAELLAAEGGLRIADGIPTVISGNEQQTFPMDGPTVYTLENAVGHEVYKNDRATVERLKRQEHAAAQAIVEADREKLFEKMKQQGYSHPQCDRIFSKWENGDETYDEIPENKGQ